jgi:hypothetical protein
VRVQGAESLDGLNDTITFSDSVPDSARVPVFAAAITLSANAPVSPNRNSEPKLSANVPVEDTGDENPEPKEEDALPEKEPFRSKKFPNRESVSW